MSRKLSVGDWVEVRSKEEILRTLDAKGRLDGMPFMPEMFQFCGKRFPVFKRAHKTCDYTTPYPCHTRRLERTVHLETRCDGSGHGGCQAGCLINWNQAWLKPVSQSVNKETLMQIALPSGKNATTVSGTGCSEAAVWENTQISDPKGGAPTYVCQVTVVPNFTTKLNWWDVRQYVEDYTSGNVGLWRIFTTFSYWIFYTLSQAGIGLGRPIRWGYDKLQSFGQGTLWPRTEGVIPAKSPTPTVNLNLQPGEMVRVKSHAEIMKTVTIENKNRGMSWDAELVPYCGGTYQVIKRVNKLIDERTGKMLDMKTACIVLDSVTCQARYSDFRVLCPKAMYPYWREIWLERVGTSSDSVATIEDTKQPEMCSSSR